MVRVPCWLELLAEAKSDYEKAFPESAEMESWWKNSSHRYDLFKVVDAKIDLLQLVYYWASLEQKKKDLDKYV